MLSQEEARSRVAKGAAHLDVVRPGWERRIDVGTLTLHDPCGCVVGQLAGGNVSALAQFSDGCKALGIGLKSGDYIDMGFDLMHEELAGLASREAKYQPLQDAWIEAIAARLHPGIEEASESASSERCGTTATGEPVLSTRA